MPCFVCLHTRNTRNTRTAVSQQRYSSMHRVNVCNCDGEGRRWGLQHLRVCGTALQTGKSEVLDNTVHLQHVGQAASQLKSISEFQNADTQHCGALWRSCVEL